VLTNTYVVKLTEDSQLNQYKLYCYLYLILTTNVFLYLPLILTTNLELCFKCL